MRFTDIDYLVEYLYPVLKGGSLEARAARKTQVKNDIQALTISAYQTAVTGLAKEKTTADLIHELCSRSVKVGDMSIQCQTEGCKEECATSRSGLIAIGEAALEAAQIEDFCDDRLICMAHKMEEDEITHQEKLAEELEARKLECHEA